jgi:hypothetical protein
MTANIFQSATRHLNVSTMIKINPFWLEDAFFNQSASHEAKSALAAWLNEADTTELTRLITEGHTDFAELANVLSLHLPPNHPNRRWIQTLVP